MWFREFNCRLFILTFLIASSLSVFGQNVQAAYDAFLKNEAIAAAQTGFLLKDLNTGKVIFAHQSDKNFVPASVQKLFLTAAALDLLGADFKYKTSVITEGDIESNILKGNLVIIASGDPTLDGDKLIAEIISALKKQGITSIEGKIKIDESVFSNDFPQSWLFEDIANHYGSSAHAFNFNRNRYNITFQQTTEGKLCKLVKVDEFIPYNFENLVLAGKPGSGDNAYILGAPFSNERQIVGTIPPGTATFSIKGAMHHPATIFTKMLEKKLLDSGIKLIDFEHGKKLMTQKNLLTFESENLAEIIKSTNRESINIYAEALLKTLAVKHQKQGSTENGLQIMAECLKTNNIDLRNSVFKDGSGLSRMNLFSPELVVDLLIKFKDKTVFVESLAVSGESGTLKGITSSKLKGKVLAKSGSSTGILNYAGYIKTPEGKNLAFAVFVNNSDAKSKDIRAAIVKLLEASF